MLSNDELSSHTEADLPPQQSYSLRANDLQWSLHAGPAAGVHSDAEWSWLSARQRVSAAKVRGKPRPCFAADLAYVNGFFWAVVVVVVIEGSFFSFSFFFFFCFFLLHLLVMFVIFNVKIYFVYCYWTERNIYLLLIFTATFCQIWLMSNCHRC